MRGDVNWAVLAAAKRREICVPTSAEPPFSRPDRGELCSHMRKGLRRGAPPGGRGWKSPFRVESPGHMENPGLAQTNTFTF